ncbi:MAG: UDP-N-acetylmuramate dehydrogenase, partial [Polyangiaceae bacterium]
MREERDVLLSDKTTLKLGGAARRFVYAESAEEIARVVGEADSSGVPVLVLGGGSNLVVGDDGFDGVVVTCAFDRIAVTRAERGVRITVDAGMNWDAFVARAVAEKWRGLECLSGIPGSVGATPMQNVGAYGQEVSDTIVRVRGYDRVDRKHTDFSRAECAFAYRTSRFRNDTRFVITEVEFELEESPLGAPLLYDELARALGVSRGAQYILERVREKVIELRRGKGMVLDANDPESVSAGSFFTNPIVKDDVVARVAKVAGADPPAFPAGEGKKKLAAAWLIERAGFKKGEPAGAVGIS